MTSFISKMKMIKVERFNDITMTQAKLWETLTRFQAMDALGSLYKVPGTLF
jgi:hypothetical protein